VGWLEEIDATLARSPGFFVGKPVVLDLSAVDLSQLRHRSPRRQPRTAQHSRPRHRGCGRRSPHGEHAAFADRRTPCVITRTEPLEKARSQAEANSLLLESPVRSGQSIVFTEGDVTVLGSVGSGAEIVAGGSIHVYGTLRGRAMAGVNGNSPRGSTARRSRPSCWPSTATTRPPKKSTPRLRNRPAQAWLEGDIMRITPLN
jgi:septum site-determining protein MinC